ncbi:hypothetical protein MtrunA17_Chr7g0257761 [Medicago truncatula]|uniref:Uncharacterized protein n=1 Tax=Medicago truncatula TaxID=3880 RepID=A0A396H5U0_MEDTR|nr:hypothetical protein MtrunA17_Chr7g0257761 [Medicago truncatula]
MNWHGISSSARFSLHNPNCLFSVYNSIFVLYKSHYIQYKECLCFKFMSAINCNHRVKIFLGFIQQW